MIEFLRMEEMSGLLNDDIEGFKYWLFIRDKVYSKIFELEPKSSIEQKNVSSKIDQTFGTNVMTLSNKVVKVSDLLYVLKNLTLCNPVFYNKHHDVLFFTSPRRTFIDGRYFEYWTDELADYYKDKGITAEYLNITNHMRPYWTNKVLELDAVDVLPVLTYKIVGLNNDEKKTCKVKTEKVVRILQEYLNCNIQSSWIYSLICSRYYWHKKKSKYFTKMLKNIHPKVIVEVCGYSTNSLTINEIASKMNIPTIELQHGIIGKEHISYNFWANRKYDCLPDKLLVFSDYWKNTCRFPIGQENIVSCGYPFAEMQKKRYPARQERDNDSVSILILSQPIFHDKLVPFIEETLHLLKRTDLSFSIMYKLHPTEYSKSIDEWSTLTKYKEVSIINNSDIQLYEMFASSDIQIGMTSTSIFEGLLYNLDTYILDIGNSKERMQDLCNEGYAKMINSPNDLFHCLAEYKRRKVEKKQTSFFKLNATNNIINEIDRYLKKYEKNK